MKTICSIITVLIINVAPFAAKAQDSTLTQIAKKNLMTFSVNEQSFKGNGWDTLSSQIKKSDYVLIGEDHLTNEIPFFCSAVAGIDHFDNFICEIDPYSAKILESKIKDLTPTQLDNFKDDFKDVFSFYSMKPEFALLEQLVKDNTSINGLDQILLVADRIVCNSLKQKTKSEKAKKVYEEIETKSDAYFKEYLKDQSKMFYMFSNEYENSLKSLLKLDISDEEKETIKDLLETTIIYKEQNHPKRVQLMKNRLMRIYPQWVDSKTLFKFGANHMAKGESLMEIFDLGNFVANIANSQYKKSLHIMIVGKSGTQASPFLGFPAEPIDENYYMLRSLKPLFQTLTPDQWNCFDMRAIREAIKDKNIEIKDETLTRIIKGFDYVVIIPQVTAASFL